MRRLASDELPRLVFLCPNNLLAQIDKVVAQMRRDDPGVNRSAIVRMLLWDALRARTDSQSGVRAVS